VIPYVKGLLYDPASFANFIRAGVFLAGEAATALGPTAKFYWLGRLVQGLALIIRAGDKNVIPDGQRN